MTTVERTMSSTSTKLTARSSSCSTVSSTRKQNRSYFAKYYSDLCHIQHSHPLNVIKQNLDKGILDFYCDRIKFEEWWSIINALSCDKTLHFVAIRCRHPQKQAIESADTELKARATTKQPVVTSRFVLLWLSEAIKMCLSQSSTLTVLQLEGLPLRGDYLKSITRGLTETNSLQHLSLSKCTILDEGAEVICQAIRNLPSIISLDLSHCGLTERGAEIIAGLIKYQKLNRYCEAWKQTLRYRDPDVEAMPGLRRITINNNPGLGDEGIGILAEEIKDDLWLRALDVQDCGLTDVGGRLLVDLVENNSNLVIVDGRGNPFMNEELLLEIMNQLAVNNKNKNYAEYKWINKNPDIKKKKFQMTHSRPRPWSCQSSTRLTGKALPPTDFNSEMSSIKAPILKRSNTTLNYDLTWRKSQQGVCEKGNCKTSSKPSENEKLRLRLQDLTLILSQEVRHKLELQEENKALKELLEKRENEKKQLEETQNKLIIEDETLKVIEETIRRFGMYLEEKNKNEELENNEHEEKDEEMRSNYIGNNTNMQGNEEYEIPDLISNLQVILKKAACITEQNADNNKKKSCQMLGRDFNKSKIEIKAPIKNDQSTFIDAKTRKDYDKEKLLSTTKMAIENNHKWLTNRTSNQIIWEEDETSSNCGESTQDKMMDVGKTKAQAMFLKILEGRHQNIREHTAGSNVHFSQAMNSLQSPGNSSLNESDFDDELNG